MITENVDVMGEEELTQYFNENEIPLPDGEKDGEEKKDEEEKVISDESSDDDIEKYLNDGKKDDEEKEDGEDEKDGKAPETEEEFRNVVDFLNKKHALGLAVDNLPEDLTRDQEAQIVSDLFERTLEGVNNKLSEYEDVKKVLEDKEVADFIKAKQEGKTLREYVAEYGTSIDGMSDEQVVKDDLKRQYPDMDDQDLEDMIEAYKEKDKLSKIADTARNRVKTMESQKVEEGQKAYDNLVNQYTGFVEDVNDVYGIPLDDKMKTELITAATKKNDKGVTYLEEALQSEQGVLLATMGILHMERLLKAAHSTTKNAQRKRLTDSLFDDPKQLQSGSRSKGEEGFDLEAANSF